MMSLVLCFYRYSYLFEKKTSEYLLKSMLLFEFQLFIGVICTYNYMCLSVKLNLCLKQLRIVFSPGGSEEIESKRD